MSVRGMHDHALRLIDHDEIAVFINNIQRDILSLNADRLRIRNADLDFIARKHAVAGLYRLSSNSNISGFDQSLDMRTAHIGQILCQI